MLKDTIRELCLLDGVSSWEDAVRDYLYTEAKPCADTLRVDTLGNLIVSKKGKKPTGNKVVAPSDSKIEAIFPTGHALALHTDEGLDVLIHVGLIVRGSTFVKWYALRIGFIALIRRGSPEDCVQLLRRDLPGVFRTSFGSKYIGFFLSFFSF